jgi:hypothetical protein
MIEDGEMIPITPVLKDAAVRTEYRQRELQLN